MNKMISTVIGFGTTMALGVGFQPFNFSLKNDLINPPRTNVTVNETVENKPHSDDPTVLYTDLHTDTMVEKKDVVSNGNESHTTTSGEQGVQVAVPEPTTTQVQETETQSQGSDQPSEPVPSPAVSATTSEKSHPNDNASAIAKAAVEKEKEHKEEDTTLVNINLQEVVDLKVKVF